ncbi:MAG: hypothetical protein AAGE01_12855 [Pseudomonadota bacterium]
MVELAQVYEIQSFFRARQDELVTLISDLEGQIDNDPVAAIKVFRGRYRIAHTLRETLDTI